ncbi:MAG: hypothetical protein A2X93_00030 [Deltaproteobacteria bacterium GWC2_56_8]|nr:MAG: hypothetical protein A2X93_00030 [Deltaproteobacteria bacterium GWC2_56_8]
MKLAMKLLVLFFGVLMLGNVAYAESPREQLRQMVEQLQKTPSDDALREKIIRLAQELKPAPAVPEEAERFEGRAQFAFSNAKVQADYLDAAKEYEKAIAAAPWVAGYYSDLCTIYQKAEKYAEAKKNCEFFLASSPSVQDASDARKRIAGLEFAMEKANLERKKQEEKLHTTEGLWQYGESDSRSGTVYEVTQHNGRFKLRYIGLDPGFSNCALNYFKATATTIEYTRYEASCNTSSRAYMLIQCQLNRETTLDCHSVMFVDGQKAKNSYGEYIGGDFRMVRRTSCKNFRFQGGYPEPKIDSADCE